MSQRPRNQLRLQISWREWWPRALGLGMRTAFTLVIAITALAGCTNSASNQCEIPEVGRGPCCRIELPGQLFVQGVCLDGLCVSERYTMTSEDCLNTLALDMAWVSDGAMDVISDASDYSGLDASRSFDAEPDTHENPCDRLTCAVGERCAPEQGRCVDRSYGRPGGACSSADSCVSGQCLTEAEFGLSGGFCSVVCTRDQSCDGGLCVSSRDARLCLRRCSESGTCRDGWTCDTSEDNVVCRPDCRRVGCGGQGRCDAETGQCRPAAVRCRYPCRMGESCEDGRCVRRNGTCVTDYHCSMGEVCRLGQCELSDSTPCQGSDMCSERQRCVPVSATDGHCAPLCQTDEECPLHRECDPTVRACLFRRCGPNVDGVRLLDACVSGALDQHRGTCLPRTQPTVGELEGYCREGGTSGIDEPCDAQAVGRDSDARAAQCQPGSLCFGDPDDPMEPVLEHIGRGLCRSLCDPIDSQCAAGRLCVPLNSEEPAAGVCLPSDCALDGVEECPEGMACVPYTLWSAAGSCQPQGQALPGRSCTQANDCLQPSLCANRQRGRVCLSFCLPGVLPCTQGECYREPEWSVGVCI